MDLEYGVVLLNAELEVIDTEMEVLEKYGVDDIIVRRHRRSAKTPIKEKIVLIENELGDRMLTGNDDGMLEREILGATDGRNQHVQG